MGIWPKRPSARPSLAFSRVKLSVLYSPFLLLMTFKLNQVTLWMPTWLHQLPKRYGPSLETDGVLMLVINTSSFVLSMAWRVQERISAIIYLTVWDTWGTTRAQKTRTRVSIPKLTLVTIDTTPAYCVMLTTSLLFIIMLWPFSTILISIINWSLTRLVIPTFIRTNNFIYAWSLIPYKYFREAVNNFVKHLRENF